MASIMDILKIKPFVEVSVGQLLWGYEDPLLKLAKDVVPKEQKLPYEEFGLLYGKNSTQPVSFELSKFLQFDILTSFLLLLLGPLHHLDRRHRHQKVRYHRPVQRSFPLTTLGRGLQCLQWHGRFHFPATHSAH
jgi:CD36 family